jgi:hypothetical protein
MQQGEREIGPQHVHGRMGEVQDVHHPENEGQACGNQEEQSGVGQSVEKEYGHLTHLFLPLRVQMTETGLPVSAGIFSVQGTCRRNDLMDDPQKNCVALLNDLLDPLGCPFVKTPPGPDTGGACGN